MTTQSNIAVLSQLRYPSGLFCFSILLHELSYVSAIPYFHRNSEDKQCNEKQNVRDFTKDVDDEMLVHCESQGQVEVIQEVSRPSSGAVIHQQANTRKRLVIRSFTFYGHSNS